MCMSRMSRLLGYTHPHKVDLNAQQKHLLVGQVVTKQDTRLASRYDKSFNVINNFATAFMVGIRIHLIHYLVVTSSLQQREELDQGDAVPPPPHTKHYMT